MVLSVYSEEYISRIVSELTITFRVYEIPGYSLFYPGLGGGAAFRTHGFKQSPTALVPDLIYEGFPYQISIWKRGDYRPDPETSLHSHALKALLPEYLLTGSQEVAAMSAPGLASRSSCTP